MIKKLGIILLLLLIVIDSKAIDFAVNKIAGEPSIYGKHSVGDLNGDGYNDIFLSGVPNLSRYCPFQGPYCNDWFGVHNAQVLLNNKKGGFNQIIQNNNIEEPDLLSSVLIDVDSDGDNDIVFSNGKVSINDGQGLFGNKVNLFTPSHSPTIRNPFRDGNILLKADFNNDGIDEILSDRYIFKRTVSNPASYTMVNELSLSSNSNIEIADFNSDGFNDILSYQGDIQIQILLNDKFGGFSQNNGIVLAQSEPLKLVVGDIDNDNDVDIVLSNRSILLNNSDGSFETVELNFESFFDYDNVTGYIPQKLIKYDADDFLDLRLTVKSIGFYEMVLINNQSGGFEYKFEELTNSLIQEGYSTRKEGQSVISADFNADGYEDFITMNKGSLYLKSSICCAGYHINNNQELNGYINPAFGSEISNLYINNKFGLVRPAEYSSVPYLSTFLVDIDSDNKSEILYSNYKNINDNNSNSIGNQYNSINYPGFFATDISIENTQFMNLDILDNVSNVLYKIIVPGDFNNDGKKDLIVVQAESIEKLYYNSPSGYSEENSREVELLGLDSYIINYYIKNYRVADINGDGFDDIVIQFNYSATNANGVYINNAGESFQYYNLERFHFAYGYDDYIRPYYDFYENYEYLGDVDNDGKDDIAYIDSTNTLSIIKGRADVDSMASRNEFSDVIDFDFYDYNFDGFQDAYINYGFSNISKYSYDGQNFTLSEQLIINSEQNLSYISVHDLNADGSEEVLSYVEDIFYIYQKDRNNIYQVIYKDTNIQGYNKRNILFNDFDGDSFVDIVIGSKVLFGREFSFLPGLNYDQDHSGHGFSIENVGGDQFYTVFYTYGSDKYPEWYADLGMFEEPREDYWNISDDEMGVVKYEYDYDNQAAVQVTDTRYTGYLAHNKCSDTYGDINLSYGIGEGHPGMPAESGDWCSKPIVGYYQRPENNLSGLWWAGSEDSGWGWSVSLVERENTTDMVLVLYYYDGEGNPRWLMGQQSGFEIGQEITLDMNMVKGYGRSSIPRDLEFIPAGTMSLTLNQASHDLSNAGIMSVDVTYPGPEGGHWVRDNMPISLFSNPR